MILDLNYIYFINYIGYLLGNIVSIFDGFSLYLLFGGIIAIGFIPLVYFMSSGRIGGKILDIGSKIGSMVGGAGWCCCCYSE